VLGAIFRKKKAFPLESKASRLSSVSFSRVFASIAALGKDIAEADKRSARRAEKTHFDKVF
jgi:hypothetical protein